MVSGDGIDHLYIQQFSARAHLETPQLQDRAKLTLTARNVNGTKNYTLTEGTVTIQ